MSVITNQPENINLLAPTSFRFGIVDSPNVNYFCQTVTLPTITLGDLGTDNPLSRVPEPGDKLFYEPMSIRFSVDEEFANYNEIKNWMVGLGFPESFDQYSGLVTRKQTVPSLHALQYNKMAVKKDGTLLIYNSQKKPTIKITFIDMYPISLSPLTFTSTSPDVVYLDCSVDFRYSRFNIEKV